MKKKRGKSTSMAFMWIVWLLSVSMVCDAQPNWIVNLPLIPYPHRPLLANPLDTLAVAASDSLARADHLKHRTNSSHLKVKIPTNPRSYGGYSLRLALGSPPQFAPLIMDTASSLVWFPCTSQFLCVDCNSNDIALFIPSRPKKVRCRSPQCQWFFTELQLSECPRDDPPCPDYFLSYGSGSTSGFLLEETLTLTKSSRFPRFFAGCSTSAVQTPEGLAGFGRSNLSIPSQLGLTKFAHCLVSHLYDDDPSVSGNLILYKNRGRKRTRGMRYTKFRKNPVTLNFVTQEYYYVILRKIIIGGTTIKVHRRYFKPRNDGSGGTIVDTASTLTFLQRPLFKTVEKEFRRQMANYSIDVAGMNQTGLSLCFRVPSGRVIVPKMRLWFKGRAVMDLPQTNYFLFVNSSACLLFTTQETGITTGPWIILGNYLMANFYIEYDLVKQRLGFKRQDCLMRDK